MRGNNGVTTKSHLPLTRSPMSHPHPHPPPHPPNGSSHGYPALSHQTFDTSGSQTDVTSLSGQALNKHVRASASKSDAYVSYKRVISNDVGLREEGSDVFGRPTKTKVAKSKSDGLLSQMSSAPKYASLSSYSKLPKRCKQSKKDKSEKLSVSNLPHSDDRPSLGRRSRTFVIESHDFLSDSKDTHDSSHTKTETKFRSRSNLVSSQSIGKTLTSKDQYREKDALLRKDKPSKESRDVVKNQWQERTEREGGKIDQWESEREWAREGARNPLDMTSLPARPKSAGQLRYCDSEESDESSLDGEIEIVDIDKELAEDPEPSPYWSEAPPLQVPEVFVVETSSSSGLSHGKDTRNGGKSNPHHHHHHHHLRQQQQHQDFQQPQQPSLYTHPPARQRHGSGESDFSAYSDTVLKPVPALPSRRRFMSEPEILNVKEEHRKTRADGRSKKGGRLPEESKHDGSDVTTPTTSSVLSRGRERLYSDTMERVLSRYSEMGLRELQDDVSGKGRASKISVGYHVKGSSSRDSVSGGMIPPPRKLKPILKQPKNDSSSLSQS